MFKEVRLQSHQIIKQSLSGVLIKAGQGRCWLPKKWLRCDFKDGGEGSLIFLVDDNITYRIDSKNNATNLKGFRILEVL